MISTSGSGQMVPLPMNEILQQQVQPVGFKLDFDVVDWGTMLVVKRTAPSAPVAHEVDALNNSLVMYRGSICELGSARDVLCSPRHPYTQALLAAVPQLRAHGFPAAALPARGIPSAAEDDAGAGCRFKARCPHKIDGICETVAPPLRHLSLTHQVACHLDAPSG
jgi:peptide/nickel transport system ATP-binding protein